MIVDIDSGGPAGTFHRRNRRKFVVRWTANLLLAIGVFLLGWCAVTVVQSRISQQRASEYLEKARAGISGSIHRPVKLQQGEWMGRIEIPSVGITSMFFEGTDEATLRQGVGHIEETAMPGSSGNVGLAGHRDTIFRGLKDIRQNDEILLTTISGMYRYRVDSTKIVNPDAIEVLDDLGHPALTLVTCYPFYFVGSAPRRFIVWAHQVAGQ